MKGHTSKIPPNFNNVISTARMQVHTFLRDARITTFDTLKSQSQAFLRTTFSDQYQSSAYTLKIE